MADDFFLFNEYLSSYSSDRLKRWCVSFGKWLLPKEDIDRIDAIKDENLKAEELVGKVRPLLQPLWSFFVALCHALQEGENELTATDAYWLGLVDEVVGEDLLSLRTFEEYKDDESPKGPDNQSNEGTK